MPLILAIEPDRRQAAHLTAVVRSRVSAELILVSTTEHALDAIGNRVPDLVLVPALLSPQDDAALATALRVIAAAANVQMLTIPVLGAPKSAPKSGGVLSALRRGRKSAEPEGCDPTVFAEQIASYLERAVQERADAADRVAIDAHEVVVAPFVEAAQPDIIAAFADAAAEPETVEYIEERAEAPEYVQEAAEPLEPINAPEPIRAEPIHAEPIHAEPIHVEAFHAEAIHAATIHEAPIYQEAIPEAPIEQEAIHEHVQMAAFEPPMPVVPEPAFAEEVDLPLAASTDESVSLALEEAVRALFSDPPPATGLSVEASLELFAEPLLEPAAEPPLETAAEPPLELAAEPPQAVAASELFAEPVHAVEAIDPFEIELPPAPLAEVVSAAEPVAVDAVEELIAALEEIPLAALQVTGDVNWELPAEDPESVLSGMSTDFKEFEQDLELDAIASTPLKDPAEAIESEMWAFDVEEPPTSGHAPAAAVVPVAAVAPAVAPAASVAPAEPPHVAGKSEREWVALIESLRHDVERLRTERAEKPDTAKPAPRAAAPRAAKASKKAKPIQDEWGFFDPEQCGFAALLAKLDEVTDSDDRRT